MSGLSSRVFEALHDGPCANEDRCDGIKAGDRIFYGTSDATVPQHVPGQCSYRDDLAAKRPMSSCCLMEQLPNGACPNGCDD